MTRFAFIIPFFLLCGFKDSTIVNYNLQIPDTISIINVSKEPIEVKKKNENAPWMVALLIGLVSAGVNIYIIRTQTQKQESIFQRNIEETRKLTLKTIRNNQDWESYQDWEKQLKIKLSSFISNGNKLAIRLVEEKNHNDVNNFFIDFEFSKIEVKILLNPLVLLQNDLNNSIDEFYLKVIGTTLNNMLADILKKAEEILSIALKILNIEINEHTE